MKYIVLVFSLLISTFLENKTENVFYKANHKYVKYVGRVYQHGERVRFWASGVYLQIRFTGSYLSIQMDDEFRYGKVLNYIEVIIDNQPARRLQLTGKENNITIADNLGDGEHTVTICKDTESENGFIDFVGFKCKRLLPPKQEERRKMEFIGDSITCGFGSDERVMKCHDTASTWYDQHNAWQAYGPITARSLKAQWHLSSVSGIGLIHSCCDKKILMPQVYDKVNMPQDTIRWDFSKYQPDVVTICLGQNDGIQDSVKFCTAYEKFAKRLRGFYPKAKLVFLTSPMADQPLKAALTNYLTATKASLSRQGEKNIGLYVFKRQYTKGCGSHPSLIEQQEIAKELTTYLKGTMRWRN